MTSTNGEFQAGAPAPDFTIDTPAGNIRLSDERERHSVVLYFMRTFDCPVCMGHVALLARSYERLREQNATVLVFGPGTQGEADRLRGRVKAPFPVIADPDKIVYAAYGLGRGLGGIQRSGSFLVDTEGVVRYAVRSTVPLGALKEPALLTALRELQPAL
jgi:peroxiredoxin